MVRQLRSETIDAGHHRVGINVQFGCQLVPVVKGDIAQTVFTPELHRKCSLLDIDVRIGKDARHIVERRKADAAFAADEQGIILGMGIRPGDQPVI